MAYATLVVDLTQDLDTIWLNVWKKRRNDIARAEREGVANSRKI